MSDYPEKESWWKNLLGWFGATRAGAWTMINVASHLDKRLIRRSGGGFNMTFAWPCLLLTTRGARTGKPRTSPLVYIEDGDNLVLIASKGGNPRHPAWYVNLRANPEVEVFVDGKSARYAARDAEGGERERLWKKAVALYSGYAKYQRRAGARKIPVVILTKR